MNYPIWELPASGLLIAFVAILHVFVSHFAVGGGLFLVVTESKARREHDDELLDYVRRNSRFFILLTLVFGAISGVGIWFTIGLVHPAATSSLINTFVWGWAIEWTFFLTEIAAALVYYYGWDRLSARQHVIVGWIYFVAAWASLAVINGILTYMLTPGGWLGTHSFIQGILNPTYWPAVVIRTLGAAGIAGLYALFTASWIASPALKEKVARYATLGYVLPMALGLPLALLWFFSAASSAGVPIAEIFATKTAGPLDLLRAVGSATPASGQPMAHRALQVAFVSITATVLLSFAILLVRRRNYGRLITSALLVCGLLSIGGAEWVREDLRKPYVIGSYMFVNGLRMPPPAGSPAALRGTDDPLRVDRVAANGVLTSALWVRVPGAAATLTLPDPTIDEEKLIGSEVFRLSCSQCHTINGYLAIRPLIAGRSSASIEGTLVRLAVPRDAAGRAAAWDTPGVQLATWRNRRMPPFAGTANERRALAVYLASVGGGKISTHVTAAAGASVFEASCAMCHGETAAFPIAARVKGRSEADLYNIIGHLPQQNEAMPPFEGSDDERHALAHYLYTVGQR